MERKQFQLNEVIFKDGVYQNWMYSICEGSIDIYAGYGTSCEKKLTTLTKGHTFGEIGMIAATPRTATAVAAEEHVVLEQIDSADMGDYLKNHPENIQPIMSIVSRRIRELTEDMSGITQMTNTILCAKETENATSAWLSDGISRLLGSLKASKVFTNEYAVMHKRQQALAGEIPPVLQFPAGVVLFREGEQADCLYDIYDGRVGIYSDYQTEDEKLLTELRAGAVFGEMGILDDMPRSATAVCLTDCTILVVKAEQFMQYFQKKPMKILEILKQMCIRLRDLTNTYTQVCESLEKLFVPEEKAPQEEDVLANLEHIRQSQLSSKMYGMYGCADWAYDFFTL